MLQFPRAVSVETPKLEEAVRRPSVLTIIALVVILLAAGASFYAKDVAHLDRPEQPQQSSTSAHKTQRENNQTAGSRGSVKGETLGYDWNNQKDNSGVKWTDVIQALATVGSVLVAIAILLVYDQQRGIMDKQAALMEGQLKATELAAIAAKMQADKAVSDMRAHMSPGFPLQRLETRPTLVITLVVQNVGRARGVLGDTYVAFSDEMPPLNFADKATMKKRADSTYLGPNEGKNVGDFASASAKDGQFCFGLIEFSDEIGRWQRRFCVQVRDKPPEGLNYFHEVGGPEYNNEEKLG